MEKILEAASRLGHLLNENDIVKRFRNLSEKLDKDQEAKKLLEEYLDFIQKYQELESKGSVIEVPDKQKMTDLTEKIKKHSLINEYFATQAYYMDVMRQINEAISNPKGDPPKKSTIITPNDDKQIII